MKPATAAGLLSDEDHDWVANIVEEYLAEFGEERRQSARAPLTLVLAEALGLLRQTQGKPIYLGREFWIHSADEQRRLNRRSAPNNPLYYTRFRRWLEEGGILKYHGPAVQGVHGKSYVLTTSPQDHETDQE